MVTLVAKAGNVLIGGDNPVVVQTMCNTHTSDVDATVSQCVRLCKAGAELVRITVPGPSEVDCIRKIKENNMIMDCSTLLFLPRCKVF